MRLFLLPILLCLFSLSKAQSKKEASDSSHYFDQMQKDVVKFNAKLCADCKTLPFSNIKIIDKRYDTSAFGYMVTYKNVKWNCKLVTGNSLAYDLENYLNAVYKNKFTSNNSTLIIVLRKFWLYGEYFYDAKPLLESNKNINYFLKLGIDFFLTYDSTYLPINKNDTSVAIYGKLHSSERGVTISESFRDVLKSISFDNLINNSSKRKKLNQEQIDRYYDKNFRLAILNDTQLKKGVYMSFDEFRKNAPSYTNFFDVRKTKLADDIYLIEGQDTVPTRKAWGYCDGKDIFIKDDMNLFKLNKQGNGFAFMGSKELKYSNYKNIVLPRVATSNEYVNIGGLGLAMIAMPHLPFVPSSVPLHLDMETGEVF